MNNNMHGPHYFYATAKKNSTPLVLHVSSEATNTLMMIPRLVLPISLAMTFALLFTTTVTAAGALCNELQIEWQLQGDECIESPPSNGTCLADSQFLARECGDLCALNSCNFTEKTCEDVWEKINQVSGCQNVARPGKPVAEKCPECVSAGNTYWDCLRDELELLRAEKCDDEKSSVGDRRGWLFRPLIGTLVAAAIF